MNKYVRRAAIGLLAGGISSVILEITLHNSIMSIFLGILVGCVYALAFHPVPRAYVDSMMAAAAAGGSGAVSVFCFSLGDAIRIRERDMLEYADRELDPLRHQAMLTFGSYTLLVKDELIFLASHIFQAQIQIFRRSI